MNIQGQLLSMNRRSVVVAFGLILIVLAIQDIRNFREMVALDLYGKARIIGHQCALALARDDEAAPRTALSGLTALADRTGGAIFDRTGRAIAREGVGEGEIESLSSGEDPGLHLESGFFTIRDPIRFEGKVVGTVFLRSPVGPILTRLVSDLMILAAIGVLGIFVASILFSRFQRTISAPITGLIETMKTIARDKEFSLRVPVSGPPEMAELAEKFNLMLETTQKWHQEILAHRQHLEELAKERTRQAQEANRHLGAELEERRRTENALRHKGEELAQVSENLSRALHAEKRFLATMSHEMRTPLNAIMGFLEVLLSTRLTEYQKKLLSAVKSSSQHLLAIICDILDVSKIDAGQMELLPEPLDLGEMLQECATLITPRIKPGVKFLYEVPRFDFAVLGDPLRLKQVFLNLLGNAAKFTEAGYVRLSLVRMASLPNNRVTLVFGIEDTGIGIPTDQIPGLFMPFRQLNSSRYEGTGLGLYISLSLVRMIKGNIEIQSREGCGTKVFVTLPFERRACQRRGRSQPTTCPPVDLSRLRVLIVEDLDLNVLVMKEILTTFFRINSIEVATNGREALDRVQNQEFDLVFMDIQMPVMDGIAATREIRRAGLTVPIVAMSAHAFLDEIERAREAGMNDYLTKPVQQAHLAAILKTVLRPPPAQEPEALPEKVPPPPESQTPTRPIRDRIYRQFLDTFRCEQTAERLLRMALESIRSCVTSLEDALKKTDPDGLEAALHKLHGALLHSGVAELAETTARLHHLSKDRQIAPLEPEVESLIKDLDQLN